MDRQDVKSKDGLDLAVYHWPATDAHSQVLVLHGYGEHAGRYAELAETLVAAGYDVVAPDLRGHGNSGGTRHYVERFQAYYDDLEIVLEHADTLVEDLPQFLIGHSFGGLIATGAMIDVEAPAAIGARLAAQRPDSPALRGLATATAELEKGVGPIAPYGMKGLVLSSPFYRVKLAVPAWKVLAAKVMSSVYPKLGLPSGLDGQAVARDPEIAALYDVDPLNGKAATARWYTESLAMQDHVFEEAGRVTLPLLLLHGEADRVADPARSAELFPRFGSADKTLELVPGAFHEIFNEPPADRKRIMARVVAWLDAHRS